MVGRARHCVALSGPRPSPSMLRRGTVSREKGDGTAGVGRACFDADVQRRGSRVPFCAGNLYALSGGHPRTWHNKNPCRCFDPRRNILVAHVEAAREILLAAIAFRAFFAPALASFLDHLLNGGFGGIVVGRFHWEGVLGRGFIGVVILGVVLEF